MVHLLQKSNWEHMKRCLQLLVKVWVTEIRLAFLSQKKKKLTLPFSPAPKEKKKIKKHKISVFKTLEIRQCEMRNKQGETFTMGPAYCFQSFQAEHKEGSEANSLDCGDAAECPWRARQLKFIDIFMMREMNRRTQAIGKCFFSGKSSWVLIRACLWRNAWDWIKKPGKDHGTVPGLHAADRQLYYPQADKTTTRDIEKNTQRRLCLLLGLISLRVT